MTETSPRPWTDIVPGAADVRLVVTDMDGTLLDAEGRVPEGLWPLLAEMRRRGIAFVPASGRQLQTLVDAFAERAPVDTVIAENGTMVMLDGELISVTAVDPSVARRVITDVRGASDRFDIGLVAAGTRSAYVERADEGFLAEVRRYYHRLEVVADLMSVEDRLVKLSIFDPGDAARSAAAVFGTAVADHPVVVSSGHWIDIMSPGTHKGHGVRALQEAAGTDASGTVVFGDYLNDLEMFGESELSFAMDNAHPRIRGAARYLAPANTEDGVVRVLRRLLGIGEPEKPQQ